MFFGLTTSPFSKKNLALATTAVVFTSLVVTRIIHKRVPKFNMLEEHNKEIRIDDDIKIEEFVNKNIETEVVDKNTNVSNPEFADLDKKSKSKDERPVCVLVLDGGGLRGVLTCEMLKEFENQLRKISGDKNIKIGDVFDLIVGTSTGGLLSLGLGKLNWNVDDCLRLYYKMAQDVFGGRIHETHTMFDSIYDYILKTWHIAKYGLSSLSKKTISMYSSKKFSKILVEEIKVTENDPLYLDKQEYFKKRQPLVATVATEVTWTEVSYPAVLRSYTINDQQTTTMPFYPGTSNASIIQAALATSAAPSYFDPVYLELDGPQGKKIMHKLVDGGLNANDPVIIAYCEAQILWPKRKIFVFSLGTGEVDVDITVAPKQKGSIAIIDLLKNSLGSLFSAKEASNTFTINVFKYLGILDLYRINPKIDLLKTSMDDPHLIKYWRKSGYDHVRKPQINSDLRDIALITLKCRKNEIIQESKL